jgi:hypothetical protein
MFENTSFKEICYFLPEDGESAKKDLLDLFDSPSLKEIYIKAYAFNMDAIIEKIKNCDSKGISVHILADFVQSRGHGSWDKIFDLHKTLKNGEILLTTAGCGSKSTGSIWHSKAMSFVFEDKSPINFEGSCNVSDTGFLQGNTIRIFNSDVYSKNFIEHFDIHKEWTIKNAKSKQIDYLLNNPITTESYELNEENEEIVYELKHMKMELNHYRTISFILAIITFFQWWLMIFFLQH